MAHNHKINYQFSALPAKAITDVAISDKSIRILAFILMGDKKRGYFYGSDKYICKHLHYSLSTVQRCLKQLEENKYIKRISYFERGTGKSERRIYVQYENITMLYQCYDTHKGVQVMPNNDKQYRNSKIEKNSYSNMICMYGTEKNIPLTDDQYDDLLEIMSRESLHNIITKLSIEVAAKGKGYENYYYAILNEYTSNKNYDSEGSMKMKLKVIRNQMGE